VTVSLDPSLDEGPELGGEDLGVVEVVNSKTRSRGLRGVGGPDSLSGGSDARSDKGEGEEKMGEEGSEEWKRREGGEKGREEEKRKEVRFRSGPKRSKGRLGAPGKRTQRCEVEVGCLNSRRSTKLNLLQSIDDLMEVEDEMGSIRDEESLFTRKT